MPLTTLDRVLQWTKKDDFAPERNAELIRCIAAASRMLTRITGRQLERVTRSISLDGYAAVGVFDDVLYLPAGDRPVLHTGSDLVTVTEDGVALTIAAGYSTSAGVILRGVNKDSPVALIRNGSSWSRDYQNILVGYKCGWSLDVPGDSQPVPDEVIQLANCLSWMIFQEPAWLGKLNVSAEGAAVTLSSELPEYEGAVLAALGPL